MGWVEKEEKPPACGYGLLRLCCSACLLGPCRISPFEKASEKGICGDSSDLMVAKNLFRAAREEALEELGFLKEAGGKALNGRFSGEIERLLSFSSQDRTTLLERVLPERVFPSLYRNPFPPGFLMRLLLDSMKARAAGVSDVEGVLWKSLQVSTIPLITEAVREDADRLFGEKGSSLKGTEGFGPLEELSSDPSPVILLLQDQNISEEEPVYRIARELERSAKAKIFILTPRRIGVLPEVGRRLSEKWGLPVDEMKVLLLVSSPSATWTLGSLALGFNVISDPDLPMHGSERVEKFFSEDLKKRLGNTYFSTRRDHFLHDVMGFLR